MITNKYDDEKTEAKVVKVWDDNNDLELKRPTTLKVWLSNGTETIAEIVLTEECNWTATVTDLPKYLNGVEIVYTWTEDEEGLPEGYELTSTVVEGTVTTLTNTYHKPPQTGNMSVVYALALMLVSAIGAGFVFKKRRHASR